MLFRCAIGLAVAFFLATSDPSGTTLADEVSQGGELPLESDRHLEELMEEPYEIRFEGGV